MLGTAFAVGVSKSLHDLGTGGTLNSDIAGTGSGQTCVFCHHPHRGAGNGSNTLTDALLWNITSGEYSQNSYAVYTSAVTGSSTQNAVGSAVDKTGDDFVSYHCMGCNTTAFTSSSFETGASDLGSTLIDDHPINFDYSDADFLGTEIKAETTTAAVVGNVSVYTYPLFSGTMQCSTCHDVHAGDVGATTAGYSKDSKIEFMNGDTAASEICVDCHLDK